MFICWFVDDFFAGSGEEDGEVEEEDGAGTGVGGGRVGGRPLAGLSALTEPGSR